MDKVTGNWSVFSLVKHFRIYSYEKFYFTRLQLWSTVSWNVSNHDYLEAERGDNLPFSSDIPVCHLWQSRHALLLYWDQSGWHQLTSMHFAVIDDFFCNLSHITLSLQNGQKPPFTKAISPISSVNRICVWMNFFFIHLCAMLSDFNIKILIFENFVDLWVVFLNSFCINNNTLKLKWFRFNLIFNNFLKPERVYKTKVITLFPKRSTVTSNEEKKKIMSKETCYSIKTFSSTPIFLLFVKILCLWVKMHFYIRWKWNS